MAFLPLARPLTVLAASALMVTTAMTEHDAPPIQMRIERQEDHVLLTLEGQPGHGDRYMYILEVTGKSRSRHAASYVAGPALRAINRITFPDRSPWRVSFTIKNSEGHVVHSEIVTDR